MHVPKAADLDALHSSQHHAGAQLRARLSEATGTDRLDHSIATAALLEENAETVEVEALTAQTLKKMILQLEKKKRTNQEQRVRFADEPGKFAESELDLNE